METLLVKLKAYDPKRGYVLCNHNWLGKTFTAERWYRVPKEEAEVLAQVRQHGEIAWKAFDDAPFAYDVCTEEEKAEMDRKAQEKAIAQVYQTQTAPEFVIPVADATGPGTDFNPQPEPQQVVIQQPQRGRPKGK